MARSTIIFGNGLGMALNPEYFSINKGLESAWNNGGQLTPAHKKLIVSAIEGTSHDNPPTSEDQLDQLQLALFAADFLVSVSNKETTWLNEPAQQLPNVFRQYLHDVAIYFCRAQQRLPENFILNLCEYINNSKSHVATLNYDDLLYSDFIEKKVLNMFQGALIDGFLRYGFSEENLNRHHPERLGWHMHLHGSPLFIDNRKRSRYERIRLEPHHQTHIVLTHIEHKLTIISASEILSTYWKILDRALDESRAIILFGYSGLDEHLNRKIQALSDDKIDRTILIVEWEGAGSHDERMKFWTGKTKFKKMKLVQMANILEFTDWASCHEVAA